MAHTARTAVVAFALAIAATPSLAFKTSTPGSLVTASEDGHVVEMPLRHTRVDVEISAFVARVRVEQTFVNPFTEPIEAVYVFPLGDRAAVDDFELTSGLRTIRGEVRPRAEARQTYETARDQGYQAALLEQERENVFTQSVSNLLPGDEIRVRLRTVELLEYTAGAYEFVFPLVVGPRYIPGDGTGSGPDHPESSDRSVPAAVVDAARISSPVQGPGLRSGHDVEVTVSLDAGVPIGSLSSPCHRIEIAREGDRRAVVSLAPDDGIPNKDFILRWNVSSGEPALGVLAHRTGVDGYFSFLVQPDGKIAPDDAAPKEIILVLDTSGSMNGNPLEMSKSFARKALYSLGDRDTFNLIRFDSDASAFREQSLDSSPESIAAAVDWIAGLESKGGTELIHGLNQALRYSSDPERFRMIVFLTDGFVGNDDRIVALVRALPDDIRIFNVGIGTSVNHSLLRRMTEAGGGAYSFVAVDRDDDRALERFRSWVTRPYLTGIVIDWGSLPVLDAVPEVPGDLYSGQTLKIVGRYAGAGASDVVVRGKLAGQYWEKRVHVVLPENESANGALGSVWARHRIGELLERSPGEVGEELRREVTDLAIEHRLLSPFTSFVAVDDSMRVGGGRRPEVRQPLPLPEGTSMERDHVVDVAGGRLVEREMVAATTDIVDIEETRQTVRFSHEFIRDLPVQGRFYTNVLTLAPGVQDADGDGNANVHGSRERDFRTVVGGVTNEDPLSGLRLGNINLDSIEEIEVVTAGAGVEFGRTQGGFANIVEKQGTNQFEGLFQASYGSRALDGNGATGRPASEIPDYSASEVSLQVAGPIVKDRLWYRLSHQWIHSGAPVNALDHVSVTTTSQTTGSDSLTWQVARRHKLAFGFLHDPIEVENAEVDTLDPVRSTATLQSNGQTYRLTWTMPVSPKLLVVSTVARRRAGFGVRPSHGLHFSDWKDARETLIFKSDIDWFAGNAFGANHTLNLGLAIETGSYGRALTPESENERGIAVRAATDARTWGLYAEDILRILSNLTLTLGVRVDHEVVAEVSNTNLSPSLAVSWDPFGTGRTKLAVTASRRHDRLQPAVVLIGLEPVNRTTVAADLRTPYANETTVSFRAFPIFAPAPTGQTRA